MSNCTVAGNEYDEGHFIAPQLAKYGGAEKLEAIKKAIDTQEARRRSYWQRVEEGDTTGH
eukprot:COSAG05_NODE_463_length_9555_cov_35.796108_1_plen_60_part_00